MIMGRRRVGISTNTSPQARAMWPLGGALFYMLAFIACGTAPVAEREAECEGPWDKKLLFQAPTYRPVSGLEEAGVRALLYDGLDWKGRPTRNFAWYGVPDNAKPGEKFPAMVLVHGGGGTAFAEWVRLWTGRGYAAIAMDTCGAIPQGTYANWDRHAHGGPAGWGGFNQLDWPVEDQWTYHAVADVILAHSHIRAFPEVDANRVGITGISWGGYLTCIVAGVDNRFRFAAPVYGCGFYELSPAFKKSLQRMEPIDARRWLNRWDPSRFLPRASMPFLWVNGTNDFAYPMDAMQRSYRLPKNERTVCVRLRMPHAHGGAGENPPEIHAFADRYLRGGPSLARIVGHGLKDGIYSVEYESVSPIVSAEFFTTTDSGEWNQREWRTTPARLESSERRASAESPKGATACFINLIDGHDRIVSSEHLALK